MIRLWSEPRRSRFLACASVDDADRRDGTDELIVVLGRLRGVLGDAAPDAALWNVVANKLAGYNARLESWFARAAAVERAARADLPLARARLLLQIARGLYPQELMLHGWLRGRGGRALHLRGVRDARRLLARHHPPWSTQPGYIPVEVPITGPGAGVPERPGRAPSVVFVGSMSNYLNPMVPVIRELCDLGVSSVVLIPRAGAAWPTVQSLDPRADVVFMEDLIDESAWRGHHADAALVSDVLRCRRDDIERTLRFRAIPLWELVGVDVLRTLADFLPQALTFRRAGAALGRLVGARAVVAARLRRVADGALAIGLREAGARCLVMPHGHMAPDPRSEFGAGSFDAADIVAAWGPDQARTLASRRRQDCPPDHILVCGNPEWDRLRGAAGCPARRIAARERLRPSLGIPPEARLGVIVSQPVGPALLCAAAEACAGTEGWSFIVKAHPADHVPELESTLGLNAERPRNGRVAIVQHGRVPLHDLLLAADAVIVFSSTVNIEALLLGTPVITLEPPGLEAFQRHPRLECFGLPVARSGPELKRLLLEFERWQPGSVDAVRSALRDILPSVGEPSAQARIVGLIRGFLGDG